MHHILGNKVLEYDVDDRGVIVDEREIDRTVNHKPNIADWVKEHMVFWYDMSKPVDTYSQNFNDWRSHPSVNADVIITSTSFVITRFATLNDTVKCYIPDQTKNFPGMKVTVEGLLEGQEIYWGYSANVKLIEITSDGTYDIPPLKTVNGNLSFRNGNIVGACNITITQLPSGQSVLTNEILKANPYLQDHSGNNRPLKLNNFLFAAMSGVGGYTLNAKSYHNRSNIIVGTFGDYSIEITAKVTDILGIVWTKNGVGNSNSVAVGETLTRPAFTITVEGMPDDLKWGMYESGGADKGNGTFEIPAYTYTNDTETVKTIFIGLTFSQSTFDNVDIKFTFQPLYPNALVTDGVDDYGEVQNFVALQNYMMFYQCAVIKPTGTAKGMFSTVSGSNNINGGLLLQNQGKNTSRFGNGTYMNVQLPNDSEVKTDYILTGNGNKMTLYVGDETQILNGTYTSTGNTMGFFLSDYKRFTRYGSLAFYKSILFDAVPAKETDGFTEQDLIDYVLENLITK